MTKTNETTPKKTRVRRSPDMIAKLILETEKNGNIAAVCRRENISPNLFLSLEDKVLRGRRSRCCERHETRPQGQGPGKDSHGTRDSALEERAVQVFDESGLT